TRSGNGDSRSRPRPSGRGNSMVDPMADDGIELRIVVPRSALPTASAPPPDFYSQHNCEALLGLTPRVFLELLRRSDAPPVKRIGKARLVDRQAMLAFISALDARAERARDEEADEGDR